MYFDRIDAASGGVDPKGILAFMDQMEQMDCRAFLVLRHGKVVAEGYRSPFQADYRQMLFSGTKSFAATVVGFAVEEGLLRLDQHVVDFFPEKLTCEPCENMRKMTVWHLLTMTTGFTPSDPILTCDQPNWIEQFLRSYVTHEPGTYYTYCNSATNILSAIVEKVTGMRFADYAKPRLLDPLEITDYHWEAMMDGTNTGAFGLNMCIEDYAKLGQLMLQKGVWNGKRIVSADWIAEMTKVQVTTAEDPWPSPDRKSGYGYQFWMCHIPHVYRADGSKGQFCVVMPKQDAVIVTFCAHQNLYDVLVPMWECLLPAMQDDIAPDAQAQKLYERRSAEFSFPTLDAAPASPLAAQYHEKVFHAADNRFGITEFSLRFGEESDILTIRCGDHSGWAEIGKNGCWKKSEGFIEPVGHVTIRAMFTKEVACNGGWVGNRYQVKMECLSAPYEDVFTFSFCGNAANMHFHRSTLAPGIVAKNGQTSTHVDIMGYYQI